MNRRLVLLLLSFAVALVAAGCASTSIQSAWFDAGYTGGPFRKIVVVGIHNNIANRRVFEDIFAAKLNAAGVQGIPGYTVIPNDGNVDAASAQLAVDKAGADGLLTVRLLGVDTKTQVSTTMVPAGGFYGPGWGGGPYGGWWGPSMVAVPEVTQYDVAKVETNLWNEKTKRVVWAATTDTFNPQSVAKETPGFADVIIGQLKARGLLPGS
jgi:hypothetical protein